MAALQTFALCNCSERLAWDQSAGRWRACRGGRFNRSRDQETLPPPWVFLHWTAALLLPGAAVFFFSLIAGGTVPSRRGPSIRHGRPDRRPPGALMPRAQSRSVCRCRPERSTRSVLRRPRPASSTGSWARPHAASSICGVEHTRPTAAFRPGALRRARPSRHPIPTHAGAGRSPRPRIRPRRAPRSRSGPRPSWCRPSRRPRRACRPPPPPRARIRTSGGTPARRAHAPRPPRRR